MKGKLLSSRPLPNALDIGRRNAQCGQEIRMGAGSEALEFDLPAFHSLVVEAACRKDCHSPVLVEKRQSGEFRGALAEQGDEESRLSSQAGDLLANLFNSPGEHLADRVAAGLEGGVDIIEPQARLPVSDDTQEPLQVAFGDVLTH